MTIQTLCRRGRLAAVLFAAAALLFAAAPFLCLAAAPGAKTSSAVYARPLTAITAARASDPVPNIGQTFHLVTVVFPGQVEAVSGFAVRLEASFDGQAWFPISADVTSAAPVGDTVYQMAVAFGPWRYLRVRCVTAAAEAMTVYYSGHVASGASTVTKEGDRFLL